jgi:hypothetical protein
MNPLKEAQVDSSNIGGILNITINVLTRYKECIFYIMYTTEWNLESYRNLYPERDAKYFGY